MASDTPTAALSTTEDSDLVYTFDASASIARTVASASDITSLKDIYLLNGKHVGNIHNYYMDTGEEAHLIAEHSGVTQENAGKQRVILGSNADPFAMSGWDTSDFDDYIAAAANFKYVRIHASIWPLDIDDVFDNYDWSNATSNSNLTSGGAWYDSAILPARIRPSARGASFTNADAMEAWIYMYFYKLVEAYGGDCDEWDIINEPVDYNGGAEEPRSTKYYTVMNTYKDGSNPEHADKMYYCAVAVEAAIAARADNGYTFKLVLNEYNQEENADKLAVLLDVARYCADLGFCVDGIGFQMHVNTSQWNGSNYSNKTTLDNHLQDCLDMFAETRFASVENPIIVCTELDVRDKDASGNWLNTTEAATKAAQAQIFADIFEVFFSYAECTGVWMWANYDGRSWLKSNYHSTVQPALWDSSFNAKSPHYSNALTQAKAGTAVTGFNTVTNYTYKVDGSTVYSGTNSSYQHTFSSAGTYEVSVTVTNEVSNTDTYTINSLEVTDVSFSPYLLNKFLDLSLRNTAYTAPTIYMALFTTTVTAGVAGTEVVATSYARQEITFGAASSRSCASDNVPTFSNTSGSDVAVQAVGFYDASTSGNLLYSKNLADALTLEDGSEKTLRFAAGSVTLSWPASADGDGISTYLANALLDHLTGNGTVSIATPYLAHYTVTPADAGGGTEVAVSGYVRKAVTFAAASGGSIASSAQVDMDAVTTGYSFAAWGLLDASTSGNLLYYGLPTGGTETIADGGLVSHASGGVTFDLTTA